MIDAAELGNEELLFFCYDLLIEENKLHHLNYHICDNLSLVGICCTPDFDTKVKHVGNVLQCIRLDHQVLPRSTQSQHSSLH